MSFDTASKHKTISNTRNSLSIDGALYHRLLAKLDESPNSQSTNPERIYRRLQYAHPNLNIHIQSDGHNARTLTVASRNLSQGGLSFLHSSFMYPGTDLTVDLIDNTGSIVPCKGRITRCEHRGGRIHEIGVMFHNEVCLHEFLTQNPETLLYSRERVNPCSLDISVMVYATQSDLIAQIQSLTEHTKLKCTYAKSVEEVFENLDEQDLAICQLSSDIPAIAETIRTMRNEGFRNPIILIGCPNSNLDVHYLIACGVDIILPLPINQQTVLGSIAEYVLNDWTPDSLESIRSCVSPESKNQLRIELTKLGIILNKQSDSLKDSELLGISQRVSMLAPVLGMDPLKSVADEIIQQLSSNSSAQELTPQINQLSDLCTSLRNAA